MNKMVNGEIVAMTEQEIAEFNASLPTDAEVLASKWVNIRIKRNGILAATDLSLIHI